MMQHTETLTGAELPKDLANRWNVQPEQTITVTISKKPVSAKPGRWRQFAEARSEQSLFEGQGREIAEYMRDIRDGFKF